MSGTGELTGSEFGSAKSGSSVGDPSFTDTETEEEVIEGCCPGMGQTLNVTIESLNGELDGQQFAIEYHAETGRWTGTLEVCDRLLTFWLESDCSIQWGVANGELGMGEPPTEICIAFDSGGVRTSTHCDPLLLVYEAKDQTAYHIVETCACFWPNPEIVFLISQ